MWNNDWIKGEDYPAWGDTNVYKKTISGGYLYNGETPREAYHRVSKTVARRLYKPEMAETFLIIFGMVGCALLVRYSQTRGLTGAYLLVALVSMLLIRFRISDRKI
jgi:hypothetical protein